MTLKRKVTDDELKNIVRARLTKGHAFMHPPAVYAAKQQEIRKLLESMSRAKIFDTYPYLTYDLKRH